MSSIQAIVIEKMGPPGPAGAGAGTSTEPHYVLAGPASGATPDAAAFRALNADDLVLAAILDNPNVFSAVNTFSGVKFTPVTITSDYTLMASDFAVLCDATDAPFTATLPPAQGSGQIYRPVKVDSSTNTVTIQPDGSDLIGGNANIVLLVQRHGCLLMDSQSGNWDLIYSNVTAPYLDQENTFTGVNHFTGTTSSITTVTADYTFMESGFAVMADATSAAITIQLPVASGGQKYYVKKIDSGDNMVTILPDGSDLIDGSASVALIEQWSDCQLISYPGAWANIGA